MATQQTAQGMSTAASTARAATADGRPRDATERMNAIAKSIAVGILIALLGIGTFGRFYSARYNGLITPQAIESAEIANHVRHGRGLSTGITYPLALKYASPNEDGLMPSLSGAPAYSLAMSLLFRIRGAGDATVSLFNGMMLLLTGWVMYSIARTLWDRTIGLFSVAVYFVSVDAIGNALSGSGAIFAGLLLTVAVWAVVRGRGVTLQTREGADRQDWTALLWPAVAGAALGLAYLSGLTSLLLAIPLAILASVGSVQRWRSIGVFAAAVAVVLAPWAIRNLIVAGTPVPPLATYELIAHTADYPGMTVYQQMPSEAPSAVGFALTHPAQMGSKMLNTLIQVYRGGPRMLTPYLFPFLILAAFIFGRRDFRRSLWRAVIAMLALQTLSIGLFSTRLDGLAVIMPIAVVLAAGTLIDVLRRTDASRWTQIGIGAAVFALILFPTVTSALVGQKMPPARSQANLNLMSEGLGDDAVILTNDPAAVAWYSSKRAILLPDEPGQIERLNELAQKHHYFYISRAPSATVPEGALADWVAALQSDGVATFGQPAPLVHRELFLEVEPRRAVPTG